MQPFIDMKNEWNREMRRRQWRDIARNIFRPILRLLWITIILVIVLLAVGGAAHATYTLLKLGWQLEASF